MKVLGWTVVHLGAELHYPTKRVAEEVRRRLGPDATIGPRTKTASDIAAARATRREGTSP